MGAADEAVPLDIGALLIGAHVHPDLDVAHQLGRIDDLAGRCPTASAAALVAHLFVVEGFRGNADDYYDPRNSVLVDVLDRKLGIPITLSVLAISVARRVGIDLVGIGLPGHFVVRTAHDRDTYFDPFNGGRVLDADGCNALVRSLDRSGPPSDFDPRWLAPIGHRAILARMLANLRAIYERRRDIGGLLWVLRLRNAMPDATDADRRALQRVGALLN